MSSRLVLLQGAACQDLSRWCDQWSGEGIRNEKWTLPGPSDLGSLASFLSALVLYDGAVLPNGPEDGRRILPDWAFGGSVNVMWELEFVVERLLPNLQVYEQTAELSLRTLVESLEEDRSGLGFGELAANAVAWHELSAKLSRDKIHFEPVLSGPTMIARCALELQRPAVADIIDRVYADVLASWGEIQLPLILSTAVSKMTHATDLLDIAYELRHQYMSAKNRFLEFEAVLADPSQPKSGRTVRALYKDLSAQLRRSAGADAAPPALLEEVPSFISLQPASIVRSLIRLGRYWIRPELRLLGRWTRTCCFDTVGRLRRLFITRGTEAEWTVAANALQAHGAVSWYPGRRISRSATGTG